MDFAASFREGVGSVENLYLPKWCVKMCVPFSSPNKILPKLGRKFYIWVLNQKYPGIPKSSILIGCSLIFTIHFGVALFLETSISRRSRYVYCVHPRGNESQLDEDIVETTTY